MSLAEFGLPPPGVIRPAPKEPFTWTVADMTDLQRTALAHVALDPDAWIQHVRDWRDDDTEEEQNRVIFDRVESALDMIAERERKWRETNGEPSDLTRDQLASAAIVFGRCKPAATLHQEGLERVRSRVVPDVTAAAPATIQSNAGAVPSEVGNIIAAMAAKIAKLEADAADANARLEPIEAANRAIAEEAARRSAMPEQP